MGLGSWLGISRGFYPRIHDIWNGRPNKGDAVVARAHAAGTSPSRRGDRRGRLCPDYESTRDRRTPLTVDGSNASREGARESDLGTQSKRGRWPSGRPIAASIYPMAIHVEPPGIGAGKLLLYSGSAALFRRPHIGDLGARHALVTTPAGNALRHRAAC